MATEAPGSSDTTREMNGKSFFMPVALTRVTPVVRPSRATSIVPLIEDVLICLKRIVHPV